MQPDISTRPTLTAAVPVYNHAALLPRALDALVNQSRLPDELIVLDDASTDSTWEVIQDYASRYSFIRPLRNERNQGVNRVLNQLLQLAGRCSYVCFTAADDYVLPGFFESAMRLAEGHPEAGIIFGGVDFYTPSTNHTGHLLVDAWTEELYATSEQVLSQWLRQLPATHSFSVATIYRLNALRSVGGFRPELDAWADTFANQAIALKHGAGYVPRSCAVFNSYGNSFSDRAVRNFPLIMSIVDQAVRLMTSSEFADRFPRDYVAWWSREYRRSTVEGKVSLLLSNAKWFWIHLAQLCIVPNAKGLAMRMIVQRIWQKLLRISRRKSPD
jgi:glycosyltransferase involved in cell wall biosynthesis